MAGVFALLRGGLLATFVFAVAVVAARPASAIEIQQIKAPGAITAWLVEDHSNPIITVRFAFRGGSSLDPEGRTGLAHMVSVLLDEGAAELDSQAFQGELDDRSITLRFSAGRDTFGGRLKTLTENRDLAFSLLGKAVTEPRFDDEPVERLRSQLLSGLRRAEEDPGTLAGRTLATTLFPGHPYSQPVKGTIKSVAAITTADLKSFVADRLARNNLLIGVVGDITPQTLVRLLASTFGALPAKAKPWAIPLVRPDDAARTIIIRKPLPQSTIVFAQEGIARTDPDFFAAFVMNYILGGGGFTSRLYDQVREKRGLAYSVYSALIAYDYSTLMLGGAGTANARVAETISVIREQWRHLATKGIRASELDDARTYLTGSFPLRFTSSGGIAGMLLGMQLDYLGVEYIERRNGYIEAVTLQDVNRVAKRLLDADKLTVVVVGDPDGLKSTD